MQDIHIKFQGESANRLEEGQNTVQEDGQIETLFQTLNGKFKIIMEHIKTNEKMHGYLQDLNITAEELLSSYNAILDCNSRIVLKSKSNKVIQQSTKVYFEFVNKFLDTKNAGDLDAKGKIGWFLQIEIKLHCCSLELFNNFKEGFDITNSPKEQYAKVWERTRIEPAEDVKKLKKDYKSLKTKLHLITSAAINESQHDFSLIQKCSFGLSCAKYLIMNDSAKLRSFLFYRKPTIDIAQNIWNLPELGATKHLTKITFEGIKTMFKIYIPADGIFNRNVSIFEERPNTITVRILYNKKLQQFPGQQRSGCCVGNSDKVRFIDEAIFHMHGGGFIALSSRSMQNYTRRWANQLSIPVFSIDYRMPPEYHCPQAPLDCLTVYRFVMNHLDYYLNIRPTKVYLAGDSAGGNIACGLTGLILKHKLTIPRGIYLAYPAVDLRRIFTSSRIHALTDPLLWPPMLVLCVSSYLDGNFQLAMDPLASPIFLTEEYVSGASEDKRFPLKWPKTIITVGNQDPLYDDSLYLMQRMVGSNIDCQCIIYDGLSHGYLSTNLLVEETGKTINHSIDHLRKLMGPRQQIDL